MTDSTQNRPAGGVARTVVIVRSDGSDLNAGGFTPEEDGGTGVDRSDSASPYYTIDGSTITALRKSSQHLQMGGTLTTSSADLGNTVLIYFPTSDLWVTSTIIAIDESYTNSWKLESGAMSSVADEEYASSGRMGGALATLGEASCRVNEQCSIYVKTGTTYTMTNSDYTAGNNSGTSGGPFYSQADGLLVSAYHTTPGDFHTDPNTRVIIDSGSTSGSTQAKPFIHAQGEHRNQFIGLEIRGNDNWEYGFQYGYHMSCVAKDITYGFAFNRGDFSCFASGCTWGFRSGEAFECLAMDCAQGFNTMQCFRCGAVDCSEYGFKHYHAWFGPGMSYCVAHDCATGFLGPGYGDPGFGRVATGCTTGTTGDVTAGMAFYNCTTNVSGSSNENNEDQTQFGIQLTAQPFNDPDAGDFSLSEDGVSELGDTLGNWGAGSVAGPNQQQSAQLKSTGGSGGGTTVPQGLHSIEAGINA